MILESINGPEDLKNLKNDELTTLAQEIRTRIIKVLATNGGHLASNLGIVDLMIALHTVFDSPTDKFLFDTSHQSYTHKILTGRRDKFNSICTHKGISGFSNPTESPHDHVHTGHAGTALSTALGMLYNRDLNNRDEYIVPIIGDATLTCGLALEALNNCSRNLKNFVVILNDNKMAISNTVGAIPNILSRLLSNPTTTKLFQDFENFISKIPGCGSSISRQAHKFTESIKHMVSQASYFEEFGLAYIGPIDGHNIKEIIDTLEGVKKMECPVIIHVLTKKGQGLPEAMKNPTAHHGPPAFNPQTGKFLKKSTPNKFPKIFGKHLLEQATKDPSVVAITPAMSYGSGLDPMKEQFPERCFDVGIAESHAATFAGGLASTNNMKVYAVIYSTFLQRALDNLFHDVCLQELPVVFGIDRAGLASYGQTHHGIYDLSFLQAMPNLVITQPRNGQLLVELMESAHQWQRPAAIRYTNLKTQLPEQPYKKHDLGKGEILAYGKDILIMGLGHMYSMALEVRTQLKEFGITATVVDPIFVKPLDSELLCTLLTTHSQIITIEEHALSGGFGTIVNDFLMKNGYHDIKVQNFGVPDAFIGHGSRSILLEEIGLTAENITKKITLSQKHENSTLTKHNQK
jgi:1-deoxy-D-xylulose-5-phosphate synthase